MNTRQTFTALTGTVLLALSVLAPGRPASADLIPSLVSVTGNSLTGYTWSYDNVLTDTQRIETGDFFTICDFNGYIAGSGAINPPGWLFSAQKIGNIPPKILCNDDPNEYNLTWKWTGPTIAGTQNLGIFSAKSIYNVSGLSDFSSYLTKNEGPEAGTKISKKGSVEAPRAPEPATLPLLGSALLGSLLFRRRRSDVS